MNTTFVTEAVQQHDIRAHTISLLGPLVGAAGIVWAILQPGRVTLLHPRGQGFWWLLVEPRPLLADLERHRATSR